MSDIKPTFEVDKIGLGKILERKGKHFALLSLYQNAVDVAGVTEVQMKLEPANDLEDHYRLTVADDSPEGFKDMTHAYTLFAESAKKDRVDQRGRFNLGEKLVIAICETAEITTTKGTISFDAAGRIENPDKQTERGSVFTGLMKMNVAEAQLAEAAVHTLIVPQGIKATFNLTELAAREPVRDFEVTLRTEKADDEGNLRPTRRKTKVTIYEPRDGEKACLYEMGIPVVETEDRWHVDIAQKVPLNSDRDNVPPGYLRDVRVAILNHCTDLVGEATGKWIDDALEDEEVEIEAVKAVVKGRYGEGAVIEDRSDPEGTKMAMAEGRTVIPGGAFSKPAWSAVKQSKAALPAGLVTPSAKPDSEEVSGIMDPEHWPEGVKHIARYAEMLAEEILGVTDLEVRVTGDIGWRYAATWGNRGPNKAQLTLNYGRLGHAWFASGRNAKIDALLIHEMAHRKVSDHFSREFYDECCRVGASVVALALEFPAKLQEFEATPVGGASA